MGKEARKDKMRTVYHGGTESILSPKVDVGRSNLDFGKGFYVTDILAQAQTWAEVKSRYQAAPVGVINQYKFDFEEAKDKFRYKKFERYDSEWLHFIVDCRTGLDNWKSFDIVEGGVANDKVIDTVEAFISGMMDEERALGELSKHQPNNQICITKQEVVDKYLIFENFNKVSFE